MSENEPPKKLNWHKERERAKTHPANYIGNQQNGHKMASSAIFRLVWQAKVFRQPQSVTVDLSPTQYIVRAECGPLIRPLQQILSFGIGETLNATWMQEWRAYYEKIRQEDEEKGIDFLRQRHRYGWRYCFSGPTGPRLASPTYPFILAHCGAWGLRTNDGLWCESYQEGIPVGRPFLLREPSPIGLLSCASLDPEFFTGLPFTEEDVQRLRSASNRCLTSHQRPLWTPGEIIANWHPQDDLVSDKMLTPAGLQELL